MARRPSGSTLPRLGGAPADETGPAAGWEALYQNASPAQRSEWLALAQRQGILYAHQLPPIGNGDAVNPDRCRQLLTLILGGKSAELEPVYADDLPALDPALDPCQRTAVARALQTPDFFLVQGFAGTGKSRVVAEIVALAAARGERVLLLAPTPSAIDRVLELASARGLLCGIRCLGREERVEALPPASRSLTLAGHGRRLQEEALPAARREVETRAECCRRRRQDEPVLARLLDLAGQQEKLAEQVQDFVRRRAEIPLQVERELADAAQPAAGSLAAALRTCAQTATETQLRLDSSVAELEQKRTQHRLDLTALAGQVEALRPLAEARRGGHWWTATWWRALFKPSSSSKLADLEAQHGRAEAAVAELEREVERLQQERGLATETHEAERSRLIAAEIDRRQSKIDAEAAGVQEKIDSLRRQGLDCTAELDPATPHPADATTEAARRALDGWNRQLQADEEGLVFARDWVSCLEQTAGTLAERLPGYANVVAATTGALPADPLFGDRSPHSAGFDLLVLEEADLVTETEFAALARRARRWILVAEPSRESDGKAARSTRPGPDSDTRAPLRAPYFGLFQRLWQQLHCDPRRLPYTWSREAGGFCCRLWPVAVEQRRWIESERVVDFPDIELRILTLPDTPPRLAEVVFPSSMSIAQAKEYIYRELEELPVRVTGPSLCWAEESDRIILQLADALLPNPIPVTLEAGVRELIGTHAPGTGSGSASAAWETCCIEFDRNVGWQRRQAEEWAQRHLGLRDLGRTAWLRTPHRMAGGLAVFLSDILFAGGYCLPASSAENGPGSACAVHFVPVPAPVRSRPQAGARGPGSANGAQRPRTPASRGGAGLELDLADARHRDRLPDELRPGLPNQGLVNYLEAQAVVRAVEAHLADVCKRSPGKSSGAEPPRLGLAVIALYASQAELIRRLLARSQAIVASGAVVDVGTPSEFRQREAPVVFLSLTRSHTHRAVAYGNDSRSFALALTRACRQLTIFGDPGTLLRRAQWQGPLEHLDEAAAARERELVEGLARYLQGQGRSPAIFHVSEGGGP